MSTINTPSASAQSAEAVDYHLVRGALWGFLLGFGVAIYLVLFAVVAFGDWLILGGVVLAGVVIGVLWARFAPPKRGDAPPPTATPPPAAPATATASASESATTEEGVSDSASVEDSVIEPDDPTPPS
ncbi:MAG: hypothetical protein AAGA42_22350 [Actinomycetota bacterium]